MSRNVILRVTELAGVAEAGDVFRLAICLVQIHFFRAGNDHNSRYLFCNLSFVLLSIFLSIWLCSDIISSTNK
jgi:hypothetical protein